MDIPDTGAIFTLGKSYLAENTQSYFFIKNDPVKRLVSGTAQSAVICDSGRLFVWGENQFGQLGIGGNNSKNNNPKSSEDIEIITKPTCVKSLKSLGLKVNDVAFGNGWCVILTTTNEIFFTGKNIFSKNSKVFKNFDKSYSNENTSFVKKPFRLKEFNGILNENSSNKENSEHFGTISAGNEHFVLLTSSGRLFGWGSNEFNQLGLPEKDLLSPVELSPDLKIIKFICGPKSTLIQTERNELFLSGQLNDFHYSSFTELMIPNNFQSPDEIAFMHISQGNEIYFVTEKGHIYRSNESTRSQNLIFQRFYDYDSEENGVVVKLLKGTSFFVALTRNYKLFTTFSESGHHLKTFREISKLKSLRVFDIAVGDQHVLVMGVPRSIKNFDMNRFFNKSLAVHTPDLNGNMNGLKIIKDDKITEKIDDVEEKSEKSEQQENLEETHLDNKSAIENGTESNLKNSENLIENDSENPENKLENDLENSNEKQSNTDGKNVSPKTLNDLEESTESHTNKSNTESKQSPLPDLKNVENTQNDVPEITPQQNNVTPPSTMDQSIEEDEQSSKSAESQVSVKQKPIDYVTTVENNEQNPTENNIPKISDPKTETDASSNETKENSSAVTQKSSSPSRSIKFDEKSLKSIKSQDRLNRPQTPYPEVTPKTIKRVQNIIDNQTDDMIENTSPHLADSLENIPENTEISTDSHQQKTNNHHRRPSLRYSDRKEKYDDIVRKASAKPSIALNERYLELEDNNEEDEQLEIEINKTEDAVVNEIRFINNGVDVTDNIKEDTLEDENDTELVKNIEKEFLGDVPKVENNGNKKLLLQTNEIDEEKPSENQSSNIEDDTKLKIMDDDDERTTASMNSNKNVQNQSENHHLNENNEVRQCISYEAIEQDQMNSSTNSKETNKMKVQVQRLIEDIRSRGREISCKADDAIQIADEPPKYTRNDKTHNLKTSKVCIIL